MVVTVKSALVTKIPLTLCEMTASPRSPELPCQRTITCGRNPAFPSPSTCVGVVPNSNAVVRERCLLESLRRHPSMFNFNEACQAFMLCDLDSHYNFIRSIILRYSLKIYGLPECPAADLFLAVYFFIEEVFGIQSKLELCVRLVEKDDQSVVGVVLDSVAVKNKLLEKSYFLEGTDVRISPNTDAGWVLDGLCGDFGV